MKYVIFLLPVLIPLRVTSQCDGSRYRELIFPSAEITTDVIYGRNALNTGDSVDLMLDVFEPQGDEEDQRPLVIFAHGGYFLFGSKEGTEVVPACTDLARMGYVTASINYRLGFQIVENLAGSVTEAVVRGVQDMKAAVRYFRYSASELGNPWGIDPDKIYVAGVSAGGFICLHLAYLDEPSEIPDYINTDGQGLAGGLEGMSGYEGYSSQVDAIISIAGALGDTSWIKPFDEPACLFHGDMDNTVPYGSAMQYIFGVAPVAEVDGSASVSQRLNEQGVSYCFETYEGQDHVPSSYLEAYYDTTLSIMSNFLFSYVCEAELDCEYRELQVGLAEIHPSEDLELFPVPTTGILRMSSGKKEDWTVTDIFGRMIASFPSTDRIDISPFPKGIYLVRIGHGQDVHVFRIIRD